MHDKCSTNTSKEKTVCDSELIYFTIINCDVAGHDVADQLFGLLHGLALLLKHRFLLLHFVSPSINRTETKECASLGPGVQYYIFLLCRTETEAEVNFA